MKPVYMINGFLESGKTEFIAYTLAQPYFRINGKTLIIVCEEGEIEYEGDLLKKSNAVVELIEEEEDFNTNYLIELEKKHKPERIIIEYNGMWNFKNMRLPWHWKVEQQITTIDGSTFTMYFANMRSLLAEMVKKSELVIFNRCDGIEELNVFNRNIKTINPKADIVFEDANGEIDIIFEEDLPYDLNASVIELDDQGYVIWYMDALSNLDRYIGKTVKFKASVFRPEGFKEGYFVPGRTAMTCCEDDMAFMGFACAYANAASLKSKDWVMVTATVHKEYWKDYRGEGPVLHAISVEKTKSPKDEVIALI